MLSLSHCQRIFLAKAPADMRKGFDGLAALVTERLHQDPLSGDAFVFISARKNMMKILLWDTSGYWLATKRLERGTFAVRGKVADKTATGAHALSIADIMNVIEGIDVRQAAYHQHYARPPTLMMRQNEVGTCTSADGSHDIPIHGHNGLLPATPP
jgi:transposase